MKSVLIFASFLTACGSSAIAPLGQLEQPVIGGALDTTHKQVVGIAIDPVLSTGVGFCTGFMIAPNIVMTARHCVSNLTSAGLICADETVNGTTYVAVRPGPHVEAARFQVTQSDDLESPTSSYFSVKGVHTFPGSDTLPNCGYDVALLELTTPRTNATPFPLREALVDQSETFEAIGYGYDGAIALSDGKRRSRAGLGISAVGEVKVSGRTRATENDWIAAEGPCGGDSGSPALDVNGNVIGVMSRGNPTVCTTMLYTQVRPFREWAKQIIRESAARASIGLVPWVAAETDAGVDAGAIDAGTPPPDAGTPEVDAGVTVSLPSASTDAGPPLAGCQSTSGLELTTLALLVGLTFRATRRARHPFGRH